MSLTIKQLRYFSATAELGQISQAAMALSISQSAITTAIKELEQSLGVELFRRSSSGMELTEHGRQFRAHAGDILARIDEAMRLPAPDERIEATLTIGVMYTVMGYFLPFHLDRLRSLYPDLRIQIYEASRESLEEGLLSNRYDLGLILTSLITSQELAFETLTSSVRRLWVSARHPLLSATEVSLEDVARERYIMLTVDEAAHTTMRYWRPTAPQPQVLLRTSSVEGVRSMVANGLGVTILSDMVYRPWSLEGRRIETIVPTDPIPAMSIGLAWKRGVEFSPAMATFRRYFRDSFQAPNQRPHG